MKIKKLQNRLMNIEEDINELVKIRYQDDLDYKLNVEGKIWKIAQSFIDNPKPWEDFNSKCESANIIKYGFTLLEEICQNHGYSCSTSMITVDENLIRILFISKNA